MLIIAGEGDDGDIDETLPADLWFHSRHGRANSPRRRADTLSTGR